MLRSRLAHGLAWATVALAPLPLFVSCDRVSMVIGILVALLVPTVLLALTTPRGVPRRLRPLAIAIFGFLVSVLFWHS